ncbi:MULTISPECIES: CoB--CoM heterodisulfide reductase iron-sulfur subunit B family protein [unclassified Lebetimonas]|uniref:CoB--CoM heterodisulfide reductase iron-sulfur subunit B family protein n=1 Tax=unclassified Lebetimonas TaxID=2648158 RepID=UPI0004642F84|nr:MULTISPECIES: CoB--CoM heterodisulfide reductase iron-sulfur subunit B family protein [unclassified Lebetimonas]
MKYALYTGCTAKESTPELLKSTLLVAKTLGIEIEVLNEASCCGAGHLQDFDEFLSLVINARNICLAEKRGLKMVTLCNTCQLMLENTKRKLDVDEKLKEKVNQKLGELGYKYVGNMKIQHFLYAILEDIGYEEIAKHIKRPLNLKIAPFYGCHIIRPSKTHDGDNLNENPYKPNAIENLIKVLMGESIDYPTKLKCCGFHVDLQNTPVSEKLTSNILEDATNAGAEAIVTPCPLCHLNLDVKQRAIAKRKNKDFNIPVLHLPEMLALAFGYSAEEIGLNHHVIDVKF